MMSLSTGDKLGPYEILSPIGAGGMGEVYRARDTSLGREVAIKILSGDVASDSERLQRFEREAKAVATLNHPNIVTIHGIHKENDLRFIVMELVEGETLDRIITPGGMPLAKIFDVAIPLADALAAAHEKGIVHRDLKPGNVMVTKEGRVKVLDFGLAKLTAAAQGGSSPDAVTMSAPLTARGMIMGTVPYMSPEQLRTEVVDHRTDLFSLGIMLYEMATGQRPFKGEELADVMSSILRDAPRPLHELNSVLPRHLGRIIEHSLEKDPEQRFQSAKDVRNELQALKKEVDSGSDYSEPVPTPATSAGPPTSTPSTTSSGSAMSAPTRRGELWIGVGVLAAVIFLAALWLGRGGITQRDPEPFPTVTAVTPKGSDLKSMSEEQPKVRTKLAILPFENISDDSDSEYLSNEIPANIIDKLSGLSDLSVISRSGAFRFDPETEDASSFGKSIGATVVLTGQLNARGNSLTIRAELVDVTTNQQLWSKRYARDLTDIMALEVDIAQSISEALRLELTVQERTQIGKTNTASPDAYRSYLQGRFWWSKFTADSHRKALRHFEQAIAIDPTFANAHAELANTYILMGGWYGDMPPDEAFPQAKKAAIKAMEIDATLAEAHRSLAFVRFVYEWDWKGAEQGYNRAIRLNPDSSTSHGQYAILHTMLGRFEQAHAERIRALELDPLYPICHVALGFGHTIVGEYGRAIKRCNEALKLDAGFPPAFQCIGYAYLAQGRYEDSIDAFQRATVGSRSAHMLGWLGLGYAKAGRRTEALAILNELEEISTTGHGRVSAAMIHAALGNTKLAFDFLEIAYEERESELVWINTILPFGSLRSHPRFNDLLRRIGLEPDSKSVSTFTVENRKTMLVVLPFKNLSDDPEQEYFSDGMTEEMITRLGRLRPELLGVIARTSAMRYKNTDKTIDEIGRELNVAYVIEGGVRRSGNRVRINAQLIQVSDQTQLWGDSYTRDLSDVFAIQAEVAEAVAKALAMELLPHHQATQAKSPTDSSAAYDAYLRGRYHWNRRTGDSLRKSLTFFHEALSLDPAFALAHVGMAHAYVVLGGHHFVEPKEAATKARAAARRALELDETLGEAHTVLAVTDTSYLWNWQEGLKHFERAIELNPNHATAHQWYAETLVGLARFEEGQREIHVAKRLDPLSPIIVTSVGWFHYFAGEFEEAIRSLRQVIDFDDTFAFAHYALGEAYLEQGKFDEGVAALERAVGLASHGEFRANLARAYVLAGQTERARQIVDELQEDSTRSYQSSYLLARIFVAMERFDEAFEHLSQACDSRDWGLRHLQGDPAFKKLYGDPRFDDLLRKVGLANVDLSLSTTTP